MYDCRIKPDKANKASTARVMYFTYAHYPEYWDEFATVFSHEAVLKGFLRRGNTRDQQASKKEQDER